MMLSVLVVFVFTVGVACDGAQGIDNPGSDDSKKWIDLNTEATKHSIDHWTGYFSDKYVKRRQFKFGRDAPNFKNTSESWGDCILNCDGIDVETTATLLPDNIVPFINVVEQTLYEETDFTPDPRDLTRQLSKITYSSVTDGWTASASLGTGFNEPILVSASVSHSQSSTSGQQTSESTTLYTKCRPYHTCYVKALTAYLTLNGTCEYEYEKECKSGGDVIEHKDACWEYEWYEFGCSLYGTIHDRYCHRNKERLPCSVTIPVMNGDRPWTHEISTTTWATPWARSLDREGLCILDPTGWRYNLTSENYVVDGVEREPVELGFPKPVDLANCPKPASSQPPVAAADEYELADPRLGGHEYNRYDTDAPLATSTATSPPSTAPAQPEDGDYEDSTQSVPIAVGEVDGYCILDDTRLWDPKTNRYSEDQTNRKFEFKEGAPRPEEREKWCTKATTNPSSTNEHGVEWELHNPPTRRCKKGEPFKLKFRVIARTRAHEAIKIVGEGEALGNWDEAKAIELTQAGNRTAPYDKTEGKLTLWSTAVRLEDGKRIEYKYIRVGKERNEDRGKTDKHTLEVSCEKKVKWDSWQRSNHI